MLIAHSPEKLHTELDALRWRGGTRRCVSLINTKGDLHEGHGAVINAAKTVSDIVVVAILPGYSTQTENIVSSNEFKDIGFVERHKADVLYAPAEEAFGEVLGVNLDIANHVPELTLPQPLLLHHLKILNSVQPDITLWGERNFIEFSQIRTLIRDTGLRTPSTVYTHGASCKWGSSHRR